MNEPSDFLADDNSKENLLETLPELLASSRQTWNKISQSLWSETSFEKLYDVISEIASKTALHDMPEMERQSATIQQYFDSFINTKNIPNSRQIEEINQLFDLLEQALSISQQAYNSGQPDRNYNLFMLCKDMPITAEISSLLQAWQYNIHQFQNSEMLRQSLDDASPAAIIVETGLLPAIASLRDDIARRASISRKPIPLIFISNKDDISMRLAAMQAGAARYFSPPHDSNQICAEIVNITTPEPPQQDKVLIIEDDPTQADFAASILKKGGMLTETVTHPLDVMDALKKFIPDLILMDIYMPDANGLELTTIIRDDLRFIATPIIFLSGETDLDKQIDALVLGGDDFISKPIRPKYLIAIIKNRIKRTRDLIHAIRLQQTGDSTEDLPEPHASDSQGNIDISLLTEADKEISENAADEAPTKDEIYRDKISKALDTGGLRNYFQPVLGVQEHTDDNYSLIISLPDDGTVTYWKDMAEIVRQHDLQQSLDQWAIDQALDAIRELIREDKKGTIFMPLSSHDIINKIDPEWIRSKLRARQMAGTQLVLEYSLNDLTSDIKGSKAYFTQLESMGIKICITDFPAKKAAFKLLRFLNVDFIKVSPKLLETENSVINTFIHQAHRLQTKVIVADISDPRYVNLHWTSNADYIQGDFISPASESMSFNFSEAAL